MAAVSCAYPSTRNLNTNFKGAELNIVVPNSRTSLQPFSFKVNCKESRIGKRPVEIPKGVNVAMEGQTLLVKGPLGELSQIYPREVKLTISDSIITVARAQETRRAREMHGLFRTLTDNMVVGVSKGFEKKLLLVGVGYRATVEGNVLVMNLGFSHPVKMEIPDGISVKVEENTRVTVSGHNKYSVGQFSASMRAWRPPEPYKGKGVKYADEVIRRKEGKAGKKK